MPAKRNRPFGQFNFLVSIDKGPDATSVEGGFQEVSGLDISVDVSEYRPGNYTEKSPIKVMTIHKLGDVTLKRGVIGSDELWTWMSAVRDGNGNDDANLRTVTITLQDEAGAKSVQAWKLTRARPIKMTGPTMSGKGNEVAIEELVLAYERLDMDFS
ncbi:MAG TPA: phage tail protein [Symbiobacteriaceae bacterium]|jgi:phage tail-like protein|nr:phage tail protein [Symbiobacteriaceae bacterium]